jgi:acetyl esterase/lipase
LNKELIIIVLLTFTTSGAWAQEPDPAERWATVVANESVVSPNLAYKKANGEEVKLDVTTAGPRSQIRPTLIYIHGGGWTGGSKEQYALWSLPFLARGMNIVNVEYRLASASLAPAGVEDCRCALRWVYQPAKEFGFDTSKLAVDGHSAGGHLSLMTGMLDPTAGFDNECAGKESLKVAAIINFFGITDVPDVLEGPNQQPWAVMWFGSQPDRMDLARRLSPITYVRRGLPPIITVHGDLDQLVPYPEAVRLHKALDEAQVPNQLVTISGGKHGSWTREQNFSAQEGVFRFLEKYQVLSR